MAWKDNLLDGKFRGAAFDCLKVDETGGRDVAKHSYPLRPGVVTEDTGLKERTFQLVAVFFGDQYEAPLKAFMAALRQPGVGELIHPVWGSIKAVATEWSAPFAADDPDYCAVSVTFIEDSEPAEIFASHSPLVIAENAALTADPVLSSANDALAGSVEKVAAGGALERIEALRTLMTGGLSAIQSELAGAVRSVEDIIDTPRAWAADVIDGLYGVVSFTNLRPDSLFSSWRGLLSDAQRLGDAPARLFASWDRSSSGALPVTQDVLAVNRFNKASATAVLGDAAAQVLTAEVTTPTLTPPQIESLVGDVRTEIQVVIDLLRPQPIEEADPVFDRGLHLVTHRPVIEALKAQALAIQEAGKVVLERRPPLVTRTVPLAGNWHLLAHYWYQDYTRATELARLNPAVRDPNALQVGDKVMAYVK